MSPRKVPGVDYTGEKCPTCGAWMVLDQSFCPDFLNHPSGPARRDA